MLRGLGDSSAFLLGIYFFVAGVSKLRSLDDTAASFKAFGLAQPSRLARLVSIVELITALGLFAAPRFVSLVAVALLAAFTTVLLRGLKAGITIGCNCFGSVGKHRVSVLDIVRNALFMGLGLSSALFSDTGIVQPTFAGVIFLGGAAILITGLFALVRARAIQQDGATRLK